MRLSIIFALFIYLFPHASYAADIVEDNVPEAYKTWLEELKEDMIKKGISEETIKKAYEKDYYKNRDAVLGLDKKQPEFAFTTTDYVNRLVNVKRVKTARTKYKELYPNYKDLEKKFGVPFNYLISFWGVETSFGYSFGNFEVIDALTNLSYDNRRSEFFRKELYEALKIMEKYDFEVSDMQGSWAGAMGHFQFMPSTFNNYAVDWNGDEKIDIWTSFDDAAASAANYLSKLNWKKNELWGIEVSFHPRFNFEQTGLKTNKSIKQWKKLGLLDINGKEISLDEKMTGSVIVPEGKSGKAYLVFGNFKKVMIWNRSENYALAVCKLADYIKSTKKWVPESKSHKVVLKTDDILKVQKFINEQKIATLEEDGLLGQNTKEAIKKLQKIAFMPQDGYPSYHLIRKIDKYNPKVGFNIPAQPKKPIRKNVTKKK